MRDKKRLKLMNKIVDRAIEYDLLDYDRMSLMMDLELADKKWNLRLEEFLDAKRFDFVHDIMGVQRYIDRQKKTFNDMFVPRHAGKAKN